MPHLHLPADHSDADLMLAAGLATLVGSEDLYVTWTHESGPGAHPEVEAILRDERRPLLPRLRRAVRRRLREMWRALVAGPAPAAQDAEAASPQARTGETAP